MSPTPPGGPAPPPQKGSGARPGRPARAATPPPAPRLGRKNRTDNTAPAARAAALAPQHEERRRDLAAAIGAVVFEVDPSAGAVFVAGRPDRLRVLEAAQIFGEHLGLQPRLVAIEAERMAQIILGFRADQPLRERRRLDQEEPVVATGGGLLVDRLEAIERRHDVEDGSAL